jgi:hypothetical protein
MTYRSYPYAWIYFCTHQYLLIFFEIKIWKFLQNLILDWNLVILTRFFSLWLQNMEIYLWCYLKIFILLIHWSHFWRIMFWTRKVNFWGETYLHLLNNRIYVEKNFENLHYINLSKLMKKSTQYLMNEHNKSFYPSNMFEFIHHPEYGCRNL